MECRELTLQDVKIILQYQSEYFRTNATRDISFRIKQLKKLKAAIKKYENDISEALYADLGKSKGESYITETGFIYGSISHAIKNLRKWVKPEPRKRPVYMIPSKSFAVREPYGTVLIIGAYNYPLQLVIEPLIGAIAAGNTAVIKTSELSVNVSRVLKKIIGETFLPSYILCVEGGRETASALINSKFDYIFFTGSRATGRLVMEAAAQNVVPVTLELGGKSPAIVDKSANLKQAARRIIWGKTINSGQTCVAPDYVIVHESVKDELILQMIKALKKYYGKDIEKSNDYGRIINQDHFNRLLKIIEKENENLVFGGGSNSESRYIEPTILEIESFNSPSMREELFGPILPVIKYEELSEGLDNIKMLQKPLALYVFTRKKQVAKKVMEEVSSGNVCINDTIMHMANPYLPFGGVGASGIGSYHGKQSFLTFSHTKGVLKRPPSVTNPLIYPPYGTKKLRVIKRFLK